MKALRYAILAGLVASGNAFAKDYKLGVVLFLEKNNTINIEEVKSNLDDIKKEIANNDVYRKSGNDTLQLVVQSEIRWELTNPSENSYNFSSFVSVAKEMKKRGIKWTPLFSIHNPPDWVMRRYERDKIRDKHSRIPTDDDVNNTGQPDNSKYSTFLPISPSSEIWRKEAKNWIEEGIQQLSPYIGNDASDPISDILVANEPVYRRGGLNFGDDVYYDDDNNNHSVITSYDDATIRKWRQKYNTDIPRNISWRSNRYIDSTDRINKFMRFRSEELAQMLLDLRRSIKNKLSSLGKENIVVTWKLTPWHFGKGANTLEQYNGWNSYGLDKLFSEYDIKAIGIDEYPGSENNSSSAFAPYISKTREYGNARNKDIYMTEFNRRDVPPSADLLRRWITDTKNRGVNYWTFFSWNGGEDQYGKPAHEMPIQKPQKDGLRLAFDDLIAPDGTGNDPSNGDYLGVAEIYSPSNNSTLTSSTATFKWNNANADYYYIWIGTSAGASNIYSGGIDKINNQVTVNNIPLDGRKIYVTMWSYDGSRSHWEPKHYIYKTDSRNDEFLEIINRFYSKYSRVLVAKSGSSYECRGGGYICQNFTSRGFKLSIKKSDELTEFTYSGSSSWHIINF